MNALPKNFYYPLLILCCLYAMQACNIFSPKGDPKEWEAFLAHKPDTLFIPLTAPEGRTSVLDTLAYGIWQDAIFVKEKNRWVEYIPEPYVLDIARCTKEEYTDSIAGDTTYLFRADGKRNSYYYLLNDTQLYRVAYNEAPQLLKKYRYMAQIEMEVRHQQYQQEMQYNTLAQWKAYLYMPQYKEVKERDYRLYWKDTVLYMRAGLKDVAVKPEAVAEGLKFTRANPISEADALEAQYWLITHDKQVMKEYRSKQKRQEAEKQWQDLKDGLAEEDRKFFEGNLIDEETRKQDMQKPYVEVVWE
ncbi:MAG: hypothetical protein U0V74_09215 [Chitinophagales bacterium]